MATPLEYKQMSENYKEAKEEHYQYIVSGAVGEFDQSIDNLRHATLKVQQERAREINRWDSQKLLAEMNLSEKRVSQVLSIKPDPFGVNPAMPPQVSEILTEARASGDPHKLRATLEVLKTLDQLPGENHEIKLELNIIAGHAKRQLEQIRVTPELTAALDERERKIDEMQVKHEQLKQLSLELTGVVPGTFWGSNDLTKHYERVLIEPNGDVKIYPLESPKVTHIYISGEDDGPAEAL